MRAALVPRMIRPRPNRVLTPDDEARIRHAYARGRTTADLAVVFGVSKRTVQRTLVRALLPVRRVRLDGWWADFRITAEGPVQATGWFADRGETTWHD